MMQLEELRRHNEEQVRNSMQSMQQSSTSGATAAPEASQRGPGAQGPQGDGVSAVPTNSETIIITGPADIAMGEATPVKTNGVSKGDAAQMLPVVRTESDLSAMNPEERSAFIEQRQKQMAERRAKELEDAQDVALVLTDEEKQKLTAVQIEARNRKKWFRYHHHWAGFVSSFRQSKSLQKFLECEPAADSPEHFKWLIATYVGHPYCTMFITFLVCFNSSLTGLYADQRLSEQTLRSLILVLLSIFTIEILLKIYAFGQKRYFADGWNVLDFTVVCVAIVEVTINYVGPSIGLENESLTSALRIVGIFRIARLFAALKELEFVVRAFVISMGSAFWVNVLVLLCLFILSLLGRLTFGEHAGLKASTAYHPHGSGANAEELFGSVLRGMATMFQVMTMNWAVPTRIISEYHDFGWFYFSFAMVFTGLGVYNLYTAIYVEKMREITESKQAKNEEKRMQRRKELMLEVGDLMNVIDTDRSGTLDRLEMEEGLALLDNVQKGALSAADINALPCLTGSKEFDFSMDHIYLAFEKYMLSNQGEDLQVPYRDIVETVFTMHDPLTSNEVTVMHSEIEQRLEANAATIQRAHAELDAVVERLKAALGGGG